MKPFRKNIAIAIDGGGIRGVVVAQALAILEDELGQTIHQIARLTAGTSTGAIIAAGIAAGISAQDLTSLYISLGPKVFPLTYRRLLFPLTRYRYPAAPLETFLRASFGERKMGDFWLGDQRTDVVITAYDLLENRNLFIKPWKEKYADWPLVKAVQASCAVPTYFPVVDGRYIDGGVGAYANPCYLAAYEASQILNWEAEETTLLSFGTGRSPYTFSQQLARRLLPWEWIARMFGAFLHSADDQQVHLVKTFFAGLDFRRYQIDLNESIGMDAADKIDRLIEYGKQMGQMVLDDRYDRAMEVMPDLP
jgi:patatin-like phospholipase/acyl hydrolase